LLAKLEPKSSLVALLVLYFGLGYAVGRSGEDRDPPAETASAPAATHRGPTHGPALSPAAPVPATEAVGVVAPSAEPAPPSLPTPAAIAPPPALPRPRQIAAPIPRPEPAPATPPAAAPAADETPPPDTVWRVTAHTDDAVLGNPEAAATVVFFSAFGCADCRVLAGSPRRLHAEYGKNVRIVFKHKLIPPPSPDSMDASIASLAAHRQGKFWEYHDRLFLGGPSGGEAADRDALDAAARNVGLDVARFAKDRADPALRTQVLRDSLLAWEVGAHSTPNVLVNGVRMSGDKTHENLVRLLDTELSKANEKLAAGAPRGGFYDALVAGGRSFPQVEAAKHAFTTGGSPHIGPAGARIEVVVFEDFECPFCARVGPSLRSFQARYPKDVRIVFKHLPLADLHANAQTAAEAAVEAHRQGKFWEMHDILFANQKSLDRSSIEAYGQQAGLDMEKLRAALDGRTRAEEVKRDVQEAERADARGTPTVFMNGRRYTGPRGTPAEGLEAVARVHLGL